MASQIAPTSTRHSQPIGPRKKNKMSMSDTTDLPVVASRIRNKKPTRGVSRIKAVTLNAMSVTASSFQDDR